MVKKYKKDELDDLFIAKKVFTELDKKQKNSYSYKNKIGSYKYHSKQPIFSVKNYTKKQTEVVIKITGSSKNFGSLKAHLKYISRNGELEIENSDENIFFGKDDLKNMSNSFNEIIEIPTENEIRNNSLKEKREVLHFVFSMKDYNDAPLKKIKEASIKTMKEIYPNNYFVIAMHNDTDNPHCHIAVKVRDKNGKRINPKKSDLAYMRAIFAKELRALKIDATATIKKDSINFKTDEFLNDKVIKLRDDYKKPEHKNHYYEVISYGEAHYKFDINNKKSFYVRYRTTKGQDIDIWADDLKRVVQENDVRTGDYCRFAITGEKPVVVQFRDKKTGILCQKTSYKKMWDVSIENKKEKALKPLKNFTPNEIIGINSDDINDNRKNDHEVFDEQKSSRERSLEIKKKDNPIKNQKYKNIE